MLTTQNVLILILCISDLLLIAFNMPLTLFEVLRAYWHTSFFGMVSSLREALKALFCLTNVAEHFTLFYSTGLFFNAICGQGL